MLSAIFKERSGVKYLPDGNVKWKDAIKGAIFTSIFFMLGKDGGKIIPRSYAVFVETNEISPH